MAFLSGELSWNDRAKVQEHVDVCPICRESAQRLVDQTLAHEEPTVQADQSIEETDAPLTEQQDDTMGRPQDANRDDERKHLPAEFSTQGKSASKDDSQEPAPPQGKSTRYEPGRKPEPEPKQRQPMPAIPQSIGKFRIIDRAGAGGFAVVYRAHNPDLKDDVALKVPKADGVSQEVIERFRVEAQTAAGLRHPNIVSIRDVEQDADGRPYVVMDWMDGGTLEQLQANQKLSVDKIIEIMTQVAQAAAHAHKRGFVHRDLKPSNILFDQFGRPHIADFGLAIHESELGDRQGELAGTRRFMSPEQIRRDTESIDGRCDVWALGVILYLLLTGKHPFDGDTNAELESAIVGTRPKPLRKLTSKLPEQLQSICLDCLKQELNQRIPSADDLVERLESFHRQQAAKKSRRKFLVGASALLTTGSLASWGGYWVYDQNRRIRAEEIYCSGNADWEYDWDGNVHFSAAYNKGLAMLGLGKLPPTFVGSISIGLRQTIWTGGIAVFVGMLANSYHEFSLKQEDDESFSLLRRRFRITNPSDGFSRRQKGIAIEPLKQFFQSTHPTKEIALDFDNGAITDVTFDGYACPQVTDIRLQPTSGLVVGANYSGIFGVLTRSALGTVMSIKVETG